MSRAMSQVAARSAVAAATDNTRGIVLMVAAMAAFAFEDMFIKATAATAPVGLILMVLGLSGATIFGIAARLKGKRLFDPAMASRPMILRNLGEVIGTIFFVSAFVQIPLSVASAILQAAPLAVTLGAALFLGERVGWRRWAAIVIGFAGVVMIVRPGLAGFQPAALLAVISVIGLAMRDLCTRMAPPALSSLVISSWGMAMGGTAGLLLLPFGRAPTGFGAAEVAMLACAVTVGTLGYYAVTQAMRQGEVGVVAPFRYTRLIFALIVGAVVFAERPDLWTLIGAAMIVGSGLYTLLRERRLRNAPLETPAAPRYQSRDSDTEGTDP